MGDPATRAWAKSWRGWKSFRRDRRQTIWGEARMTLPPPHIHLQSASGWMWGNILVMYVHLLREEHRYVLAMAEAGRHLLLRAAADARRHPPKIAPGCCLGPGCSHRPTSASPQPRLPEKPEAAAEPGQRRTGWEENELPENSFIWKGQRGHNSDLQVWRLFKGVRRGRWRRFFWRKNGDTRLF